MKKFKHIVVAAALAIGAFSTVIYTSCNKDACKDVTCQNGGTCSGGNCTCTTGYEGTRCETESRSNFTKSWSATDVVGSTTLSYTGNISATAGADVTAVTIGLTFSDNFFTVGPIKASISGTTITIPSQNPDGNNYSLSGSGTLANGKITWSYTITNTATSQSQVYTATWQ